MLTLLRRILSRRPPPASPPPALRCLKDLYVVPYCQYRSAKFCTDEHRRYMCAMVWEKGEAAG